MTGHASNEEKRTANNFKSKLFIQPQSYIYCVSTYAFVCLDFNHYNCGHASPNGKKEKYHNYLAWFVLSYAYFALVI